MDYIWCDLLGSEFRELVMFTLEWALQQVVGISRNVTKYFECKQSIKRQLLNVIRYLNLSVYPGNKFYSFN